MSPPLRCEISFFLSFFESRKLEQQFSFNGKREKGKHFVFMFTNRKEVFSNHITICTYICLCFALFFITLLYFHYLVEIGKISRQYYVNFSALIYTVNVCNFPVCNHQSSIPDSCLMLKAIYNNSYKDRFIFQLLLLLYELISKTIYYRCLSFCSLKSPELHVLYIYGERSCSHTGTHAWGADVTLWQR